MAQVQKYAFDTEFAPNGAILRDARLSPEQIKAAHDSAYESGKADALAHAERRVAAALEALADAASAVVTRLDAESRTMRNEAAMVALVAARKIAGEALHAFGDERAAAAIEAAMDALRHQPRLVVKLAPQAASELGPRIAAMCASHAYAGAVLVREDAAMSAGEVTIDWSDGVITINPEEIAGRVQTLVDASLAQP